MNKYTALKWSKFVGYVAGGGLSAVFMFFSIIAGPKNAPLWTAAGPAIVALTSALNIFMPQPSQASVQDATIVTPKGTPTGATVLSTTSELLPQSQPK